MGVGGHFCVDMKRSASPSPLHFPPRPTCQARRGGRRGDGRESKKAFPQSVAGTLFFFCVCVCLLFLASLTYIQRGPGDKRAKETDNKGRVTDPPEGRTGTGAGELAYLPARISCAGGGKGGSTVRSPAPCWDGRVPTKLPVCHWVDRFHGLQSY